VAVAVASVNPVVAPGSPLSSATRRAVHPGMTRRTKVVHPVGCPTFRVRVWSAALLHARVNPGDLHMRLDVIEPGVVVDTR
jgi:hypothetical protein